MDTPSTQFVSSIFMVILCLTSAVSNTEFENRPRYIQKGEKFVLSCKVLGLGVRLWYKDGKPLVSSSNNKFHLEQNPPVYSKDQSDFVTEMRLIVDDADSIHTGEYACNGAKSYTANIIVLTEDGIRTNADTEGMGKKLIPGEPLVLQCNITECRDCTVRWYKDGKLLHPSPDLLEMHDGNNSLVVHQPSYGDTGAYVCALDTKRLDVTFNATLIVRCGISFSDHRVKYYGKEEVSEGDSFKLSCVMPVWDPPQWILNSSMAIHEENNFGYIISENKYNTTHSEQILEVQSAQLYLEGEYRCSNHSRDFHYVQVIPLTDDPEDEWSRKEESSYSEPYEYKLEINQTYEFFCASAEDDGAPIKWHKNRGRILTNLEPNIYISGRNLTIHRAQEDDAGEYMCTVDPPTDPKKLDKGRIFQLINPAKIIDIPQRANIIRGDTLTLYCKADGYPEPKITWFIGNLNASQLKEKNERISIHLVGRANSSIVIKDMTEEDRGLYTCRAENSVDSTLGVEFDEKSTFVHVRENMIESNEDEPGMGKILIPGEQLILRCSTPDCPLCEVVWFKDGELLQNIPGHLVIDKKNNSVIIEHSSYNDSGVYLCAIDRELLDVVLNATINVQSKINLKKFDASSIVVEGSPLELICNAEGAPGPYIKWFIGDVEIGEDDERIQLVDHNGIENGKLLIDEVDFQDRNHYTCEAYNQVDSVNTTTFIRIKDKFAALWPFLGICAEVAILCSIIFVYERRKSMTQCDEPETDLPTENKHHRDQKAKGQDIRQRK